jgi:YidC/Oxa1 family membrane protein insertase
VDVQYFAALVLPQGNQIADPYLSSSKAMTVGPNRGDGTDLSVLMTSKEIELPAADGGKPGTANQEYFLFAGPKREGLLRPIGAEKIIDYGISGRLGIPQAMLALLGFFHNLFPAWAWPYGWSIILLTVVVRSAMFPFSRKQAMSTVKMQELQPEIAALKKKYANDTDKLGKAQMELFRKHNYNPFGGCLVLFVQLPIFWGLYQALNISVDLRSAKFLWIDNLAAPDALFKFPFPVPFLGPDFNLLPLISMALFLVQQKMMMPPPTDKEQEMQQKMMTYMSVFMGFVMYWMPSGLCLYFIASSLWGWAERKLLPKAKKKSNDELSGDLALSTVNDPATKPTGSRTNGKWSGGKGKSKQRR